MHFLKAEYNLHSIKLFEIKFYIIIFAITLITLSGIANAQCDRNLIGLWSIKYSSIELDKDKKPEESTITWDFNTNGKANFKIPPFLDVTSDFECNKDSVIIKKTVPATLNIIRITEQELVWKEAGDNKYFYWVK